MLLIKINSLVLLCPWKLRTDFPSVHVDPWVTSLVLFCTEERNTDDRGYLDFSALSCMPVSNPSRQACTANLFQHQVSGSGTDMHITLRLEILMLTFNKSYLGYKLSVCVREREREKEGEIEGGRQGGREGGRGRGRGRVFCL